MAETLAATQKRYRVLTVDDSLAMQGMLARFLRDSEFDVVGTAKDGVEAIERFRDCSPDLVLLDVVMGGKSGLEVLGDLLAINPAATVGIVSSLGTEDMVKDCLQKGAKSFLQKPFTQTVLMDFVRRLTREGVSRDG